MTGIITIIISTDCANYNYENNFIVSQHQLCLKHVQCFTGPPACKHEGIAGTLVTEEQSALTIESMG